MMRFFRDNGLLIVVFAIFMACLVGQAISGYLADQQDRAMHGVASQHFASFLESGAFLESVFENWESEFLEKWAYVFLTAYLVQRGSAESKDPDAESSDDEGPAGHREDPDAPWPVRRGGLTLWLYSHSLGIALFLIFAVTFVFPSLAKHAPRGGGSRAASPAGGDHFGASHFRTILVRKLPELAKRVFVYGRPGAARNLAKGARLSGKQACACAAR